MRMWLIFAALAAVLIAAGCSGRDAGALPPEPPAGADALAPADERKGETVLPAASPLPVKEREPAEEDNHKNEISVASPQKEIISPESAGKQPVKDPEQKTDSSYGAVNPREHEFEETLFDPMHPSLMGVSIGTRLDTVLFLYGEPTGIHLLPEDEMQAAVYRYDGFSIGITDQKVLFVEVSSKETDPKLNGVRIGDTRDKAVGALGKPTAESEYVLNYTGNGSILRLDLHPDTKLIHSIKLFPEQ